MMNKERVISVRLDNDLAGAVDKWLAENPGFTLSRLTNLAIRQFICQPQTLRSIVLKAGRVKPDRSKKTLRKSAKKR